MIAISVVSSVLGFGMSILLARLLGPEGFQSYAVVIAGLTLLGTVCEFGTGKYAFRTVPEYTDKQQWSLLVGYGRFSLILVLGSSLLLMVLLITLERFNPGMYRSRFAGTAVCFLPVIALVAVAAEFVMAHRRALVGSMITRLICPLAMLFLLAVVYLVRGNVGVSDAIVCFGGGSLAGLLLASWLIYQATSGRAWSSHREYRLATWLRNCLWYSLFAFLASWMFRVSVLVLHGVGVEELEVARFVAALETSGFILLAAKSTNKLYQPELSLIMSQGNWERGLRMRRSRRLLIGSASAVYFAAMLIFGKTILAWFGPEYVAGYPALCLISAGTCLMTTFAMAPEYLKFSDKMKTLLAINGIGGLVLVVATILLGARFGATGAGAAFGLVLVGSSVVSTVLATRQVNFEIAQAALSRSEQE